MTAPISTVEHLSQVQSVREDESPIAATIGIVTIGQSPRADHLGDDVRASLGPRTRVIERGALDDMNGAEIAAIAPTSSDDYRLITLLRNGRSVEIAKQPILERLQRAIGELETRAGVDATLLVCTGTFPSFTHRKPLLAPQAALYGAVAGMAGGGRIGALIPLAAQRQQALAKWRDYGIADVQVFPASPYGPDPARAVAAASADARVAGASLLFMDCFGYDRAMKAAARRAFGGPVVLARTLAARLIAELAE